MAEPVEVVGDEDFRSAALARPGVWAVAFIADWCPHSRAFVPRFAALADRYPQLLFGDLSNDDSPLWDRLAIGVVPTVIVFVDGQPHDRFDGIPGVGLPAEALDRVAEALDRRGAPPARRPRRSTGS